MKISIHSLAFFVFFIAYNLCYAQENIRIIDNPDYELRKDGRFSISKIELTDTETRIHIFTEWLPDRWITHEENTTISNPETGKVYKIKEVKWQPFGKHLFTNENGHRTDILIFPPLGPEIKKIDFYNSYFTQFYGVSLKEPAIGKEKRSQTPSFVTKWIDDELALVKDKPLENYESPEFFSKEPAKLIGYVRGYDPRLGFETGIYYAENEITNKDYPITIEISPDGRFEAELPLIHPTRSFFLIDNRWFDFYVEPGQTLAMILDWEDFLATNRKNERKYNPKSIVFKGNLARINQELAQLPLENLEYEEFKEKSESLSPDDFKKLVLNIKVKNEKKIDSFITQKQVLDKTENLLYVLNDLETSMKLFNFSMNRDYYSKQDPSNEFLKMPVPQNYYDFLKEIPMDKQALLVGAESKFFINRFEFMDPFKLTYKTQSFKLEPEISFLEYAENENIKIAAKDLEDLRKRNTEYESGDYKKLNAEELKLLQEQSKAFNKKYKKQVDAYNEKYIQPLLKKMPKVNYVERQKSKDSILNNVLQLEESLIYDITKIRSLSSKLKLDIIDSEEAYPLWDFLSQTIENPFIKAEGQRILNTKYPENLMATDAEGKKTAQITAAPTFTLPDGKAKDLFYDIANEYKGKIVFVDFWATSCGPCVGTIKRIKEIRAKYKDNPDFEFLFITDESQSPETRYTNFVSDQNLIHTYRVTTDNYNRFRQLFKFNGIPKYVVLDKKGKVINDHFQMHNFENELPEILEMYK